MADLSDVQNAIVALAAQILYPGGTGQPSIAGGVPVRIYAGWPNPATLDADLKVGACHVSVFSRPDERNTTRFMREWRQHGTPAHTMTLEIDGQAVTVGGTIPPAGQMQNLAIIANGAAYTYTATHADTLTTAATALAALAAADIDGAANTGPVITFPPTTRVTEARIGGAAALGREIRRQERVFQVTAWADTPSHRDAIVQPLDAAMADTPFLMMPDGFAARFRYRGSPNADDHQLERLYRRDLLYTVEYATTQTEVATEVIVIKSELTANNEESPVKEIQAVVNG